jgi:hypothetical protein
MPSHELTHRPESRIVRRARALKKHTARVVCAAATLLPADAARPRPARACTGNAARSRSPLAGRRTRHRQRSSCRAATSTRRPRHVASARQPRTPRRPLTCIRATSVWCARLRGRLRGRRDGRSGRHGCARPWSRTGSRATAAGPTTSHAPLMCKMGPRDRREKRVGHGVHTRRRNKRGIMRACARVRARSTHRSTPRLRCGAHRASVRVRMEERHVGLVSRVHRENLDVVRELALRAARPRRERDATQHGVLRRLVHRGRLAATCGHTARATQKMGGQQRRRRARALATVHGPRLRRPWSRCDGRSAGLAQRAACALYRNQ